MLRALEVTLEERSLAVAGGLRSIVVRLPLAWIARAHS
jgi:hypothetical protein